MYTYIFFERRLKIPFALFESFVLDHLHITPSQLHPNASTLVRANEILIDYFSIPTPKLPFFFIFNASDFGGGSATL